MQSVQSDDDDTTPQFTVTFFLSRRAFDQLVNLQWSAVLECCNSFLDKYMQLV